MIEAYDLRTLEQMAQFRTVSPVAGPGEEALGATRLRTSLLQVEGPLGRHANENTRGFYSEVDSRTELD